MQILTKVIDKMQKIGTTKGGHSRIGLIQMGLPDNRMTKLQLGQAINVDQTTAKIRQLEYGSGNVD